MKFETGFLKAVENGASKRFPDCPQGRTISLSALAGKSDGAGPESRVRNLFDA
jgi:hypothetical protein